MKYLDSALSFIAPHHCFRCHKEGAVCCQKCLAMVADPLAYKVCYRCSQKSRGLGICQKCRSRQSLDSVSWYADYKDPLASRIVKSLKFDDLYGSAGVVSHALKDTFPVLASDHRVLITSAITAGKRSRARGWDQARLIAKAVSKQNRVPYKSLLVRTSSFDQIGSTKSQRIEASKKFFKTHRRALIEGSIVVVVDDVITTGATLNAAASALKSAGAKEVHGLVFARQGLYRL